MLGAFVGKRVRCIVWLDHEVLEVLPFQSSSSVFMLTKQTGNLLEGSLAKEWSLLFRVPSFHKSGWTDRKALGKDWPMIWLFPDTEQYP